MFLTDDVHVPRRAYLGDRLVGMLVRAIMLRRSSTALSELTPRPLAGKVLDQFNISDTSSSENLEFCRQDRYLRLYSSSLVADSV